MASQSGREKTEEFEYDENRSGHLTIDADLDDEESGADRTRAVKISSKNLNALEDSDDDFWEEDDVKPQKKLSPIEEFLKKQLPFIFNLIHKEKPQAIKTKTVPKQNQTSRPTSLLHKLFPFLNKVSEGVGSKPAKEQVSPASKFPIKPIHVVVLIGLGIFLFMDDEEINTEIPEVVETSSTQDKVQEKKPTVDPYDMALNKKSEDSPSEENIQAKTESETVPPATDADLALPPEVKVETENTQDISISDIVNSPDVLPQETDHTVSKEASAPESTPVAEKKTEVPAEAPVEAPKLEAAEEAPMVSDENPAILFEEEIKPLAKDETPVEEEKIVEIDPNQVVDINLSNMGKDISTEILKDLEKDMKSASISNQVRSMQGPVAAPDYDSPGPGLVYNCKEGHWACVDKVAHGLCAQNYAWNHSKGIKIECYVQDLYEQDEICNFVQQQKINKAVPTSFCNGNN